MSYTDEEYKAARKVAAELCGYIDFEWRGDTLFAKGASSPDEAAPIRDPLPHIAQLIAVGFWVGSPEKRNFAFSGTEADRIKRARAVADQIDLYDKP